MPLLTADAIAHLKRTTHADMTSMLERADLSPDARALVDAAHLALLCSWKVDEEVMQAVLQSQLVSIRLLRAVAPGRNVA